MLPILISLTGCSIVLVDEPCDTAASYDTSDTGVPALERFIDIGTGAIHTCGIRESGELLCWGANDLGQLDAPSGQFTSLSVGHAHSCALSIAGDVQCWGRNDDGQTDLSGSFISIAAGGAHTCGLTEGGDIQCVGRNDFNQLQVPDSSFSSIAAGMNHTCATTKERDGVQNSVCWGSIEKTAEPEENHRHLIEGNEWGCAEEHGKDGTVSYTCRGDNTYDQHTVPDSATAGSLTAGARHGCALTDAQTAVCWGANDAEQLDVPDGEFARIISGPTSLHTCALSPTVGDEIGALVTCWGLDAENQLQP